MMHLSSVPVDRIQTTTQQLTLLEHLVLSPAPKIYQNLCHRSVPAGGHGLVPPRGNTPRAHWGTSAKGLERPSTGLAAWVRPQPGSKNHRNNDDDDKMVLAATTWAATWNKTREANCKNCVYIYIYILCNHIIYACTSPFSGIGGPCLHFLAMSQNKTELDKERMSQLRFTNKPWFLSVNALCLVGKHGKAPTLLVNSRSFWVDRGLSYLCW